MKKLFLAFALLSGVAGCAQTLVGSESWFATPQGKAGLLRRASFDLECEEAKLTLSPLGPPRTSYQSTGVLPFSTTMRFQNRKENGLGIALPGGSLALFEPAAGSRLLVGEGSVGDYAEGEEVEIQVGASTQVTLQVTAGARGKSQVLTASNANPYPVRIEVSLYWPDGKRVRASQRLGTRDGRPVWAVEIPANSSVTLTVRK